MKRIIIAALCCAPALSFAMYRAASTQAPDRLAQFREQERAALAEPFRGVTTDGKVVPGLFGIKSTGEIGRAHV